MRKSMYILLTINLLLMNAACNQNTTVTDKTDQVADRVADAQKRRQEEISEQLQKIGANWGDSLYIRAFKQEKQLEVWIWANARWNRYDTYKICKVPGELGPKRREGDLQVPEGAYTLDKFNPKSSFHLSLRVNYPNASDAILSDKKHPGGEIYMHGGCASTGCLPILDENIEVVYLLALAAKQAGQEEAPIHIFPFRMTDENMARAGNGVHRFFWANLQGVYESFNPKKALPKITVDKKGRYFIASE